jgi:hypothetical protein
MGISKSDIWNAAAALNAEGIKPTLNNVRKRIGAGSFTTISDAMTEWHAKQQAGAVEQRDPPPAAVAERMTDATADLWALALEAAQARLAAERERMEVERAGLQARYDEAAELAGAMSTELEQLQAVAAEAVALRVVAR